MDELETIKARDSWRDEWTPIIDKMVTDGMSIMSKASDSQVLYAPMHPEEFCRRLDEIEARASVTGKANNRQEGGTHYRTKAIQPWDYIAANGLGYFEGNVVKYVTRYAEKNGLSDLRKARHYLDKLIEIEEAKIVGNG